MKNGRYEEDGIISWYKDDVLHREDGPAIEHASGTKMWVVNGEYHRIDGPARIWPNGDREWWVDDRRHRLDGPAFEGANGTKYWFVDGQEIDITAIFGHEPSVPLSAQEQMILRLST